MPSASRGRPENDGRVRTSSKNEQNERNPRICLVWLQNVDFAGAENQIRKWITLLGWDRFHRFWAAYRMPKNL